MPVIARFYGLIIKMFFQRKEHNPLHFHAVYGEYVGAINIRNPRYVGGRFASEGSGPGEEWGTQHRTELLKIWETQEFIRLPPLE